MLGDDGVVLGLGELGDGPRPISSHPIHLVLGGGGLGDGAVLGDWGMVLVQYPQSPKPSVPPVSQSTNSPVLDGLGDWDIGGRG